MKYNIFPLQLLSSLAHPIPFHPLPGPPHPIPPPPHPHCSGRCESCSELQGPGGVLQDEGEISGDSAEPCRVCHQRTVHVYSIPQFYAPQIPIYVVVLTLSHMPTVYTHTHTHLHTPHTPTHTYTHPHPHPHPQTPTCTTHSQGYRSDGALVQFPILYSTPGTQYSSVWCACTV